eukprot:TRINITY_DN2691_c0_g1_i1.p1 TRINITY_DN2691_c0_g1~~TRINITY_DN2691_c0_g1_i1.p1  ORF type:complete len:537 (-),score=59.13 TRINITY_DN2691_c0_g1_i1:319-1929(-)
MASGMLLRSFVRRSRLGKASLWPQQSRMAMHSSTMTLSSDDASVLVPEDQGGPMPLREYDILALETNRKLRKLKERDERFLRYANPVAVLLDHGDILLAPATKVTTLPNGMRVATESNLASETATIGIWIDAGSRFETDETNGVAHFLEHMIFKGTAKRSVRALEESIENIGGHLNAYTSREQTTYYAKVLKRDVPEALDILADILQNSTFQEDRIRREREVILREMQEVEGQAEEVVFDHLHATAFQHSPLGRTILGPERNIKSISKNDLEEYIKTHYTTPRMVVSAAGAVDHQEIVELTKKLFTKFAADGTTTADLVEKEPTIFTGSEVRMIDDDIPLAQFAVAFNGASWKDPDSVALMVMQTMLGSWNKGVGGGKHMGSVIAQMVATNDLAESFMAFNTNYKDAGLFGVYAIAKPDRLDDLAWLIMHEMTKMVYRVSEDDVTRARNQLKSSLQLHLDGTSPIAEDIGRQLLTYGRRVPLAELFARIDAVDAATVKRVANRFIFDRDIAIAAMGPVQTLPDYNWFRRRTFWLRY